MMKLYNTLSRGLEEISTSNDGKVHIYNCGPTVYWAPHIGNLRAFITWDVLTRALKYSGVDVLRVMNLTDVGHMTDDEDFGEDKMDVASKREGVTPIDIANKYIKIFLNDMYLSNVQFPNGTDVDVNYPLEKLSEVNLTRATDYVAEMIKLIVDMEAKGYTYQTKQAVYFDVSKYPEYSKLSGQQLDENMVGARGEVRVDSEKKNPADFVLWMKATDHYADHTMKWESPWGVGFPGWHIECSAMGMAILGDEIDIHTGGIEHIGVHHPNERAQNFGATGKEIVKMWVHNEHLQSITGDKLAKSSGNAYTLTELIELGFDPMDFRLLIAINNYRVPLKFSLDLLTNVRNTRLHIIERLIDLKKESNGVEGIVLVEYKKRFIEALENDLNVSVAFSVFNEVLKAKESAQDRIAALLDFDRVFAIGLAKSLELDIDDEVEQLAKDRALARKSGDYKKADDLREQIYSRGYIVKDVGGEEFTLVKIK